MAIPENFEWCGDTKYSMDFFFSRFCRDSNLGYSWQSGKAQRLGPNLENSKIIYT
jgi:hypothetical protein